MSNTLFPLSIVGAQWGDEGKGKLVDVIAEGADYVVRYNGGNNAGHTVVVGNDVFKLSLLPSGVVQRKNLVIAQGCVIDPKVLIDEIEMVTSHHLPVHLCIDPRVQIVMPYHKALDHATEQWKGKAATGSLHLGIGYCYEDKNNRAGIRFDDLLHPHMFRKKLETALALQSKRIERVYGLKEVFDIETIWKTYVSYGKKLKQYVADTSLVLEKALQSKKHIIFEGAHGSLLDPVFGTYPYTVAIHTISGSIFPYVGLAPRKLHTLGIVKAYTTRVGNGPFPTELNNTIGKTLQEKGKEFGTVSKRPRRCGWLDLPGLATVSRLSGFTTLAITKLDVLSGLKHIRICIGYKMKQGTFQEIPASMYDYARCIPVYTTLPGWSEDISHITSYANLPKHAKDYLMFIKTHLRVPIAYVSVGPKRSQILKLSKKEGSA